MTVIKSPMLAKDYDPSLLKFPVWASPKIDGIRCHIADDVAMSRTGKPIRNEFIQEIIGRAIFSGLDGELIVGNPNDPDVYNKTSSGVMSKDGQPDFKFFVFDDYTNPEHEYHTRRLRAMTSVTSANNLGFDRLVMLEQVLISNMDQLDAYEAQCLAEGYEGIMIRAKDSPYKFGRSTVKEGYLLKVKRFAHDEAEIIGVEEQMHNANEAFVDEIGRTKRSSEKEGLVPSGLLGAYIVQSPKWPKPFRVSCGTMSHQEKEIRLRLSSGDLGRIVRFRHLPHGAKDLPRHPLFDGFRSPDDM